jgi:outer membrane protein TolC
LKDESGLIREQKLSGLLKTKIIIFHFSLFILLSIPGLTQERNLDYYLSQGIANSPELKDLSNQVRANSYDSLIARAGYLPQVNFNSSLFYAPVINGWGYSEVITNGQSLVGTVNVNQQIFNKKTREAYYQKYGYQGLSLQNSMNIGRNELFRAITAQYLAVYSAWMEGRYKKEILDTVYDTEKKVRIWVEKGIYRQTDWLLLKVEMRELERNISDLEIQFRKELSNLNIICGINDSTVYAFTLPSFTEKIDADFLNSPLFRKFVYDSLQIQNEKLLIDRKYKPSLTWFSDGGIINNEPKFLYQNFGISIGLGLTLPVYDGNQRILNYSRLRVMEETRKGYEGFFRSQYLSRISQLREELDNVKKLGKESNAQVDLVLELVRQDKVLLDIGSLPVTDYLLAMKSLIDARHNAILYQIRAQYLLNEINFLKQ